MSRARDLSRLSNPSALSVSSSNNRVGINSTIPGATLDVAGIVSATSFYGDATNLSNISSDKISEGNTEAEVVDSGDGYFKVSIDGTESLRVNSASLLEATGAADVRLTLGSSGTAGTNDSVHIRADSADLKFMSANTGNTIFERNGTESLRINSAGKVLINSTDNSNATMVVKNLSDDLHPVIKVKGVDANGYTFLGDEYTTDESQFSMGVMHSSAAFLLGWGVKPSNIANDTYLSTQDTYATKHSAVRLDVDGLRFLTNSSSQTVTTNAAVTLTERVRIIPDGTILAGGQTSSIDGAFTNLELRKDDSGEGGSLTLVNDHAASASATCSISVFQNFRNAGEIVFGRENANNWQSSAAGAASFIAFKTNNAGSHTERLRILADGTTSIGTLTSTPGTIAAGSLVVTNTNAGIFSNNGGDAKIGSSDNQALFLTINGSGKVKLDTDGRLLIGPGAAATPKCGYAGIDVPNYDYTIVMGGSDGNGNRANAANKDGRLCGSHYTNAEEPIGIIRCTSGASDNDIYMGGGSSLINAATLLSFYTAADTTTTTGTERLRIDRNGNFIFKNGALIENGFYNNSTALTGDYDFDLGTYGNVHYSSPYVAGAFTYNLRINASTSLNSVMDTGDTISVTLMTESNNTSYYMTAFKIDSVTQTVKWSGGSAPSAATGSGLDVYTFTVMKMGSNSYKCFGTLTNHA